MTQEAMIGHVSADGLRADHQRNVRIRASAHEAIDHMLDEAMHLDFHGRVAISIDINEGIAIAYTATTEQQHRR